MEKIEIVDLEHIERWHALLEHFPQHDVYYLPEYAKAYYYHGDGIPELTWICVDDVEMLKVSMKKEVPFSEMKSEKTLFDYITPYGYGGCLWNGTSSNDKLQKVKNLYEESCRKRGIVSEFVRFHPLLIDMDAAASFYDVQELGVTVSISLNTPDDIWNNFSSKNRNKIRKALKSGLKVYWGQSPILFQTFREIYEITMKRDAASDYYYFGEKYYQSMQNDLKNHVMIFYVELEHKIIAASIMMYYGNYIHYHLSGSLPEYRNLAPSNLLLYETACWGCANGFRALHLGGGLGAKKDSLYEFKKGFNRNENHKYYVGKRIYMEEVYQQLVEERKKKGIINENFFPAYRG